MKRGLRGIAVASALSILGSTAVARADGAELAATALFDEARKLMAQHKFAEACPKLAESQRLAPNGGTLINLAECYEHTGQTANAWGAWKDVAARANSAGRADAEQDAIARANALEPLLARLAIVIPAENDVPGLIVKRDGLVVGRAEFGIPIPVDPGEHVIEATAPGKKPWSIQLHVAPKQADARVTVLLVGEEPAGGAQAGATPEAGAALSSGGSPASGQAAWPFDPDTQRTVGWSTLGVGGAGLVAGAILGGVALAKSNHAKNEGCSGKTCPTSAGVSDTKSAIALGNASTATLVVGGVLAAAGVALVLTAPSGSHVQVAPAVGWGYGGVSMGGGF